MDQTPGNELYVVQFVVQPLEAIKNHLTSMGARVHHYMPTNSLLVRMTPAVAAQVEQQRYVRWVGAYRPSYRVATKLMTTMGASAKVYVRALDAAAKPALVERVRALGGTVHDSSGSSALVIATLSRAAITALATENAVEYIDGWSAPEADMDLAREISGSNFIEGVAGYTGAGIRAEVMDGNVLETHGDFASRPLIIHGMNRTGDRFHGTATTGIVFGDGAGNPMGRGVLSSGQGIFASYEGLADRYAHTAELLAAPYFASFQSNSWGGARTTEYTNVSAEMDRILFDHDILIFQSQSNAGSRQSRPEAWAKNVVSIGAFNHKNTLAPGDDRWEGTASIGPAADGRIKPDLAHFYDATFAPSSSGSYDDFGGTSGATPITAGHAGIFLEMWADGLFTDPGPGTTVFEKRPHMTTSKAMLINSAWRYAFANETADMNRHHQGWGRVDLKKLYELREKFYIVNETDVLSPLASTRHQVTVASNEPELRITLVYADPPGTPAATHTRVNDLTLHVTSPSGVEYFGNNGLRQSNVSTPGGSPDTLDTVENVFLVAPEAGTWTIEIRADEIVADGHTETAELDADYALVASGVSGSTPPPPPPTGRVRISQVAYDTPGNDTVEEWIELYNPTSAPIDVGSFRLADNGGSYTLPPGTVVAPGKHLAIARNAAGFNALFGRAPGVAGMTLSLGNAGDEMRLLDLAGAEIDRVQWENTPAGWPIAAPTGSAIVRIDPSVDTGTVSDWKVAPATPR
jgi:serine protease AprX